MADTGEKPGAKPPSTGANHPNGAPADTGAEDIEAFLASLEAEDAPTPSATAVREAEAEDPFAAAFAELDALQPDDLPAIQPEKSPVAPQKSEPATEKPRKPTRQERAAEKQAAREAEKQQAQAEKEHAKAEKERLKAEKLKAKQEAAANEPRVRRWAKAGAKGFLMALPALVFAWVFGAYLGHLISAGWLIAILAILVAFGLPLLLSRLAKRGRFGWWCVGAGVLLSAAAVAPMPNHAGSTLMEYGHWPATALTEVASWQPTNALVQFNSATANLIGGLLLADGIPAPGPMELGTKHSLYRTETPTTPAQPGAPAEPTADKPEPPAPE